MVKNEKINQRFLFIEKNKVAMNFCFFSGFFFLSRKLFLSKLPLLYVTRFFK